MVAREILGELVARELGVRDDAMHDARLLEQLQVAVGAALGEPGLGVEDLRNRERPSGGREDVDECVARRCGSLTRSPQPRGDGVVERIERGHGEQV